jgi:hypothetical protein
MTCHKDPSPSNNKLMSCLSTAVVTQRTKTRRMQTLIGSEYFGTQICLIAFSYIHKTYTRITICVQKQGCFDNIKLQFGLEMYFNVYSSVLKYSGFVECDTALLGKWFSTFRKNICLSF